MSTENKVVTIDPDEINEGTSIIITLKGSKFVVVKEDGKLKIYPVYNG